MCYHVLGFNCMYVASIYKSVLRQLTAVLECFSAVSRVNVYHPGEMVNILHSHLLIVYWRLLSFVHVLCLLLCDDRASCKTACGWWVIPYKYVLIKNVFHRLKDIDLFVKLRFINYASRHHISASLNSVSSRSSLEMVIYIYYIYIFSECRVCNIFRYIGGWSSLLIVLSFRLTSHFPTHLSALLFVNHIFFHKNANFRIE